MRTCVCKLMLGKTRDAGYVCYDSTDLAFHEMTVAETKCWIEDHGVNGLTINALKEIELDSDDYIVTNLMTKSGVGNYKLMVPNYKLNTDTLFYLTKVIYEGDGEPVYEVVSSKCARLLFGRDTVLRLYKEGLLNGLMLADDMGIKDEIVSCGGVEFVDLRKLREEHNAERLSGIGDTGVDNALGCTDCPADSDNADAAGAGVGFDDVKDWLLESFEENESEVKAEDCTAPEEAAAAETDPVAVEDEKKPKSKRNKSKMGLVKNNARKKN